MLSASAIFNPTPDRASRLLADLDDTTLSFDDLAKKHGTNSDALALWLSTDPVKDRIQTTLDGMALRVRRVATARLPAALTAVMRIVESPHYNRDHMNGAEPLDPNSPGYAVQLERLRRRDQTIIRACTLVLRMCNFFSPLKPPKVARFSEPYIPVPRAEPPPAQVTHRAPNPGAVPLGLHPPTSTPAQVRPAARTNPSTDRQQPAARTTSAPAPAPATYAPLPTAHSPLPTLSALSEEPLEFSVPSLTLVDFFPDLPPVFRGPRGPALVISRAGATIGAGP